MNIAVVTTRAVGALVSSDVLVMPVTTRQALTIIGIQGPPGPSGSDVWAPVPLTADAEGIPGQKAYDGSYLYICVADHDWRRTAVTTWGV